jgi:hypothetical protein
MYIYYVYFFKFLIVIINYLILIELNMIFIKYFVMNLN